MLKTSKYTVGEVCNQLSSALTLDDRIQILRNNDSIGLQTILRLNYEPGLVLDLPELLPSWKKSNAPIGFGDTTLKSSARSFYVFIKESSPGVNDNKRLNLYLSLLEALDPLESEILEKARLKKLDLGLSIIDINQVYPGLIRLNNFNLATNITNDITSVEDNPPPEVDDVVTETITTVTVNDIVPEGEIPFVEETKNDGINREIKRNKKKENSTQKKVRKNEKEKTKGIEDAAI